MRCRREGNLPRRPSLTAILPHGRAVSRTQSVALRRSATPQGRSPAEADDSSASRQAPGSTTERVGPTERLRRPGPMLEAGARFLRHTLLPLDESYPARQRCRTAQAGASLSCPRSASAPSCRLRPGSAPGDSDGSLIVPAACLSPRGRSPDRSTAREATLVTAALPRVGRVREPSRAVRLRELTGRHRGFSAGALSLRSSPPARQPARSRLTWEGCCRKRRTCWLPERTCGR